MNCITIKSDLWEVTLHCFCINCTPVYILTSSSVAETKSELFYFEEPAVKAFYSLVAECKKITFCTY